MAGLLEGLVNACLHGVELIVDLGATAVGSDRWRQWGTTWLGLVVGIVLLFVVASPFGWVLVVSLPAIAFLLGRSWQRQHERQPPPARPPLPSPADDDDGHVPRW